MPRPPYLKFFALSLLRSFRAISAWGCLIRRYGRRAVSAAIAFLLPVVQLQIGLPLLLEGFAKYRLPPKCSLSKRGTVSFVCLSPIDSRKYMACVPRFRWPIVPTGR